MSYRQDKAERKKKAVYAGVSLLAVILAYQSGLFSFLNRIFAAPAQSFLIAGTWTKEISQEIFSSLFSSKKSLLVENTELRAKLNEIETKLLETERLRDENEKLKSLFGRTNKGETVIASVIARPNQSPYDTLILDAGSNDGVIVGSKIIAFGSVVLGEISDVFEDSSRAKLFSSYGEEHQAILSKENTPVKIIGRGGGNFLIELPREAQVEKGEAVISSGLFPKTLGIVDSISVDSRDPFQKILLRSPVNIMEIRLVEISI